MTDQIPWDFENSEFSDSSDIGLESLGLDLSQQANILTQGCAPPDLAPYFNPCNIVIEKGIYYLSLYICCSSDDSTLAQRLTLWLASLKDTDIVKLSVGSKLANVPLHSLTTILAALRNTEATIEIIMDQIVIDSLAYFYLVADKIDVRPCGRLFIPSYVDHRTSDMSGAVRAVSDFYKWIVELSFEKGRLTSEEVDRLNSGHHVIIPRDRFN